MKSNNPVIVFIKKLLWFLSRKWFLFRDIQSPVKPWHIQNQRYGQNSGIFRTIAILFTILVYSEPWYIQNLDMFRTRGIFRTLEYSEPQAYSEICQISWTERFGKLAHNYNYLSKLYLFSQYQLCMFCTLLKKYQELFKTSLIFTPEIFIISKKVQIQF